MIEHTETRESLEVLNLETGYGDLRVVRDVSISVPVGTITAVLGRNGAGKSTTLKAIAGLLPVRAGDIRFEGESISKLAARRRRYLGFGFVQENKRVFKRRSVRENLILGLLGSRLSRVEKEQRIDEAYTRFPILGEKRGQPAGFLSGGQQQMLAIAQALASRPRLVMLDEPSAGLAPSIVSEVMELVRQLRDDEGLSVLLVEQAVDTSLAIADHVVVLDTGRSVHSGPADEPGLRDVIEAAYMTRIDP